MKSSEFIGCLGGDCECWCLFVSEEEYRRVCGEEAYQEEKQFRQEMAESTGNEDYIKARWKLYPDDLFHMLGVDKLKEVRFRLEIIEEGA